MSPVLPDALGGGLSSGHRGTWPVAGVIAFAFGCILLFGFSPTLNPLDIVAGKLFEVSVPRITGDTQVDALAAVQEVRLRGEVEFDYSSTVKRGLVISQDPPPASTLDRGGKVTLVVSRGPQTITVIDFVQMEEKAAEKKAKRMGLAPSVSRENSETVPKGIIIGQDLPVGATVLGGRAIAFRASLGPASRPVPETAGLSIEGAAFRIGASGFQLGSVLYQDSPTVPAGGVISADPPAGTVKDRDSSINLVVSLGGPPLALPNVVGQDIDSASEQLSGVGFVVGRVNQEGSVADPLDGAVTSQLPLPGTPLRPGEVVTLTVRTAKPPPPTTAPVVTAAPTPVPEGASTPAAPAATAGGQ